MAGKQQHMQITNFLCPMNEMNFAQKQTACAEIPLHAYNRLQPFFLLSFFAGAAAGALALEAD
jgi:hypothetical protein